MRRVALLIALAAVPLHAQDRTRLQLYAVGDLNLGRGVTHEYLLRGDTLYPFAALLDTLRAAHVLFGNLESPIAPIGHPYERTGSPVFTAPPIAADALVRAGFDVVSTANNHAWDGGLTGVMETLRQLERVRLPFAGTGRTIADAHRPAIIEKHGWRLIFFALTRAYNPAPRSFYRHVGSRYIAYADTAWLYPAIRRVKALNPTDLVIVSIHAGEEYTPDPDEPLVVFVRGAVDAGADIILGHHPHVVRHVEWYRGKPIAYSLGNFIFQQRPAWTDLSAIFRFTIDPPLGTLMLGWVPIQLGNQPRIAVGLVPIRVGFQARLAEGGGADSVRRRVGLRPGPPFPAPPLAPTTP
jgi:poly-gamma-glutamate capsule biosynthesis protein CapA/YwtB (metallophosphatase superfamily)